MKLILSLCLALFLLAGAASAATLNWDADGGTTGNQDGSGVWDTTVSRWNGSAGTLWNNATPDSAVFGAGSGAAGTVTLGTGIVLGNLTVNAAGSGGYTIAGGAFGLTIGISTTTATAFAINADATITAPITVGNAGDVLTESGAGTLTLAPTGNSTFGQIKVSAGTLVLDGAATNSIPSTATGGGLQNTATTAAIRVNGGVWSTTTLGTNNTNASFRGTLEIDGGSLVCTSGRYIGEPSGNCFVTVNGGSLVFSIPAVSQQFSPGNAGSSGPATVTVTGGLLDVASCNNNGGGHAIGAAYGSLMNQTGGTVNIGVTTGAGGTIRDFKIGGTTVNAKSAYTLAGGSLFVAGTLQSAAAGTGGINNFNFLGGNLSAGTIITANLSRSSTATASANQTADATDAGYLVNLGGALAPGGVGTAGRTTITGNYIAAGGTLAIDLGGTKQGSAFQTGDYDFVNVTGTVALGGNLSVSLLAGYTPAVTDTFTILTAGSMPTGAFTNAPFGNRFPTADGAGSFLVTLSGNSVVLTQYQAVPPTVISTSVQQDAGTTQNFTARADATDAAWTLDGVAVSTTNAFTYAPDISDVGPHLLAVDQTLANNTHVLRQWKVTVNIPVPVSSVNYYVSPTGLDTNGGTLAAPFKTLDKAAATVRGLARPLPAGGVTVWLRGGTYFRTATLALTGSDSGTAAAPVIYRAYPGETPVISAGKAQPASAFSTLAASEQGRVTPGLDPTTIKEMDLGTAGVMNKAAFPALFDQWPTYNVYHPSTDGGLCELLFNGKRMFLSRYPNHAIPTDGSDPAHCDDVNTTYLAMDGVTPGADTAGTGYLNGPGTYTDSSGKAVSVGGAFYYYPADAAHVQRWQTALSKGGLWLQGYWRVPWQINGVKITGIDTAKRVFEFDPAAQPSGGIGNKYTRPQGNYAEHYWVVNLLEEIDQPGEWAIDFSRNKLYFLPPAPITDGSVVISDLATPMIQMSGGSYNYFVGLTFEAGLASGVQVLNGSRNLVLGCEFRNLNNMAVDLNGGDHNGVVSSYLHDLGGGGVLLQGGKDTTSPRVAAANFAVNNQIIDFARVSRIYQAAVDTGFNGPGGGSGGGGHDLCVGMRIAHNFISGTPHGGVLHGDFDNVFEYNDVSNFCLVSDDLGAFYAYDSYPQSGNETFRYNFIHDSAIGDCIYFDGDHRQAHIYGNVMDLRPTSASSQSIGIWYKNGTQATYGNQQTLDCYNNLAVNCFKGIIFVGALPSVIQNNATVAVSVAPYTWTLVNVNSGGNTFTNSSATAMQSGPNLSYSADPGFINEPANDLRLNPVSSIYSDNAGFKPIPFEMIGLYNDAYRTNGKVLPPLITTGSGSNIGGNTATFNGTLAFPVFNDNTAVTLFWGTGDGGTSPAGWQNAVDLGQPGSGTVSTGVASLQPGTRYYFRYRAVNSAGTVWASLSNSFTTYPLNNVATGGTAGASSGTAANAFDGNPATAWAATGSTGVLTYRLPTGTSAVVTRYQITSAASNPARDPRDWQFQGSADGVAWVTLDTRAGETFTGRGQTKTYNFANSAAYGFYRLNITANAGDAGTVQLSEFQFFDAVIVPDTTPPVITTPGNLNVTANTLAGAQVGFSVTAVDAVSGNAALSVSPASGSVFPVGTTTVNVSAVDAAGNPANASFTVTVTMPPLPQSWVDADIGTVLQTGRAATFTPNVFSVSGAGKDIGSNSDSFHFVYRPLTGDGVLTARVASLDTSGAKVGVMMRNGTAANVANAFVYYTPAKATFQQRTAVNGSTANVTSTTQANAIWVRLVRSGNVFTGYASQDVDGLNWTQFTDASGNPTSTTISMASAIQVGLAVNAHDLNGTGYIASAAFDNVSLVTPTAAPTALTATPLSDSQVRLSWTETIGNEDRYTVERSPAGAGTWTTLATLPAGTTSWVDVTLAAATNYDFRVTAVNAFYAAPALVTKATPASIGDGIPGAWRYQYFGNGVSIIAGVSGANDDPDGDGMTNLQEYLAGTDPTSAASRLTASLTRTGNDFQISFPSVAGRSYVVERTFNLAASPWPTVVQDNVPGTGATVTITDANAIVLSPGVFYRVRVKP